MAAELQATEEADAQIRRVPAIEGTVSERIGCGVGRMVCAVLRGIITEHDLLRLADEYIEALDRRDLADEYTQVPEYHHAGRRPVRALARTLGAGALLTYFTEAAERQ